MRYLDAKYSRWLSCDPALSDYMSSTEAGCGGIYNSVNLSLYHYAGNNPVKYTAPTGLSTCVDEKTGTILSATNDNDCGVYAYPTVDGQRVEGLGLLTGLTGTPGYFVSTLANPGIIQISGQETNYIGQNINNYGSGFAYVDFNYSNLDSTTQNTVSANVKKRRSSFAKWTFRNWCRLSYLGINRNRS